MGIMENQMSAIGIIWMLFRIGRFEPKALGVMTLRGPGLRPSAIWVLESSMIGIVVLLCGSA